MSCLESWVRSLLHQPVIRSLEQRYDTPIGYWTW